MRYLKNLKLFERFDWVTEEWINFINRQSYLPNYLKEDLCTQEVLDLWKDLSPYRAAIKPLVQLFDPKVVEHYNSELKNLYKQDSHIKEFYKDAKDFISVLKRLRKFTQHPDRIFILTQLLAYVEVNVPTLRYFSEESMKHVLANRHLNSVFSALWERPIYGVSSGSAGSEDVIHPSFPGTGFKKFGIKPFLPTSDKELEEKIVEIILDSHRKNWYKK